MRFDDEANMIKQEERQKHRLKQEREKQQQQQQKEYNEKMNALKALVDGMAYVTRKYLFDELVCTGFDDKSMMSNTKKIMGALIQRGFIFDKSVKENDVVDFVKNLPPRPKPKPKSKAKGKK
jgi:hypothetical protein